MNDDGHCTDIVQNDDDDDALSFSAVCRPSHIHQSVTHSVVVPDSENLSTTTPASGRVHSPFSYPFVFYFLFQNSKSATVCVLSFTCVLFRPSVQRETGQYRIQAVVVSDSDNLLTSTPATSTVSHHYSCNGCTWWETDNLAITSLMTQVFSSYQFVRHRSRP